MSQLILYDNPVSSNALKVRFLAAELGLALELRTVSMARPRSPEYLSVNPLGGIPTLQDGALTLSESHAILRYLAARESRDDLYPSDPIERARVDEFLDRFATRLRSALFRHEALALGYRAAVGFDVDARDPAAAAAMADEIAGEVALLDRLVEQRGAVLDRFTIADCALAPVLFRTQRTDFDLAPYPNLAALRSELLARPAWAQAGPVL